MAGPRDIAVAIEPLVLVVVPLVWAWHICRWVAKQLKRVSNKKGRKSRVQVQRGSKLEMPRAKNSAVVFECSVGPKVGDDNAVAERKGGTQSSGTGT